ncbi:MAG: hypothetical protein ACYTGG_12505 [Planctomycetota bacterium]
MPSPLRIIVTGLVAQHPRLGGISWHYLQYVVGLARLGHDVTYLEDSGEYPYNLDGGPSGTEWVARDCRENVAHLTEAMTRFDLEDRWAYRDAPRSEWFGLPTAKRTEIIRSADVLINVSGTLEHPSRYREIPRLIYIDTDPVVTQVKLANGKAAFGARVDAHDVHFSFGERFSDVVPVTGHGWLPTRQPIVLSEWRPQTASGDAFTTVMNWTSYEPLRHGNRVFGQKDVEFKRFLDLPTRVAPIPMEVALSRTQHLEWEERGAEACTPRQLVTRAGWRVVDANDTCSGLDPYRDYIECSRAEWSIAKNTYVQGRPGWFSERSACYLAAGRPVVVQDTGFGDVLPVGEGLLSFETMEQAIEAIREVQRDYARHAIAARAIAEEYFDAGKVLSQLLDQAMSCDINEQARRPSNVRAAAPETDPCPRESRARR